MGILWRHCQQVSQRRRADPKTPKPLHFEIIGSCEEIDYFLLINIVLINNVNLTIEKTIVKRYQNKDSKKELANSLKINLKISMMLSKAILKRIIML